MPEAPHRKRAKKLDIAGHAHFMTFSCYQRLPLLTNDAWRTLLATAIRNSCDMFIWLVQGKRDGEPLRVDDWDETTIA